MQPDLFLASDEMHRAADISPCRAYRWTLERRWAAGPRVCWIGLNPSTADAARDDPTVRRWIAFTRAWGYGGFVAVNLYPYRSPDPTACRRWSESMPADTDWDPGQITMRNVLRAAREAKQSDLVLACWGAGAWNIELVRFLVGEITTGDHPWPSIHCIGKTESGAPKHPLARGVHRVPDDALPIVWATKPSDVPSGSKAC